MNICMCIRVSIVSAFLCLCACVQKASLPASLFTCLSVRPTHGKTKQVCVCIAPDSPA